MFFALDRRVGLQLKPDPTLRRPPQPIYCAGTPAARRRPVLAPDDGKRYDSYVTIKSLNVVIAARHRRSDISGNADLRAE
jgi:hypothetical protein